MQTTTRIAAGLRSSLWASFGLCALPLVARAQETAAPVVAQSSWDRLFNTELPDAFAKGKLNLTMLCDFYEFTMGNGYFKRGYQDRITYFDVFFRSVPDNGGFAIAAGLEQAVDYIRCLRFEEEDLEYLRSRQLFDEGFLDFTMRELLRQFFLNAPLCHPLNEGIFRNNPFGHLLNTRTN